MTASPKKTSWPRKEHKEHFRNYLPEHIVPAAKAADVKGIVALQSGQTPEDNQWNLDITKDEPLFKGVIGNFSILIGTDEFAPAFNKERASLSDENGSTSPEAFLISIFLLFVEAILSIL